MPGRWYSYTIIVSLGTNSVVVISPLVVQMRDVCRAMVFLHSLYSQFGY